MGERGCYNDTHDPIDLLFVQPEISFLSEKPGFDTYWVCVIFFAKFIHVLYADIGAKRVWGVQEREPP
jgi:hypothetical protein